MVLTKALVLASNYVAKTPIPNRNNYFSAGGLTPPAFSNALDSYLNVGWLHAVVFRIALGCSEVEWTLFDSTNQEKPKQIYKHPVLTLLKQVNPFQTSNEFIALDTIYNELVGESFWALNLNALGEPAEIILPYPQRMSVVPAKEFPFVKGYVYGVGAEAVPFDINEIIHFKYPNPLNQYRGLAPARAIGINLDAEQNADKWVNQFFYNSARPDGVISFDYNLSDEQFDKLKKQWSEKYKGVSKAHQIALLEGGGKYLQIQNSIKDMDFANLKQKNRDVILGVFGMPQSVMGISTDVNKANAIAGDYTFARWIVKPRLEWKKAKLQEQLLPKFRRSENLTLGFEEVVPATIEEKRDLAESGMRAGYLTINEARKLQHLDPLPAGDVLLVPLNLIATPIDKIEPEPIVSPPVETPPISETPEEIQESYKGGEGSGNFDHEGRPGEVGGSGEGGGGGGNKPSSRRESFIKDNVKVTGRSKRDQESLPVFQKELSSADIPDSHLDSVKSIEINATKTNARGGFTIAYCDGGGNLVFNGVAGQGSVVHEIGHAYFQKKIYVRGNDDKYKILDAFSASQKTGKGFASLRAKADPDEYFAESYAAYAKDSKSFTKSNPTMGKLLGKYWK